VSRKRYKLTEDGIVARNELLSLLELNPEGRIAEAVARIVGLESKTIVKWLVKEPLGCVQIEEMEKFFIGLVTAIRTKYNGKCDEKCQIYNLKLQSDLRRHILITEDGLKKYFYHDYNNDQQGKKDWIVPDHFYKYCNNTRSRKSTVKYPKTTKNLQNSVDPAKKIADLLWNLDYRIQEKKFAANIEEDSSHAIAFSIVAPSPHSDFAPSLQQWLLCRLCQSIENDWLIKAKQILIEPPKCKSGDTGWGLIDICQEVEKMLLENGVQISSNKTNDILDTLAKYSAKYPILIRVRNLHHQAYSKKILIDNFWKELVSRIDQIPLSRPMKRSRLIMFVLEDNENTSRSNDNDVYPLSQLDIKFEDIDRWTGNDKVRMALAKCDELNEEIDQEIEDLIDNKIRGWPCWDEPITEIKLPEIFEGLCRLFDSGGYSSKRVSEYWKI
jgi:hypothetical protein